MTHEEIDSGRHSFADPAAQFPERCVACQGRRVITVSFTADGGDEETYPCPQCGGASGAVLDRHADGEFCVARFPGQPSRWCLTCLATIPAWHPTRVGDNGRRRITMDPADVAAVIRANAVQERKQVGEKVADAIEGILAVLGGNPGAEYIREYPAWLERLDVALDTLADLARSLREGA